jgi:hypothetical protein
VITYLFVCNLLFFNTRIDENLNRKNHVDEPFDHVEVSGVENGGHDFFNDQVPMQDGDPFFQIQVPSDSAQKNLIDLVASFVASDGEAFEQVRYI